MRRMKQIFKNLSLVAIAMSLLGTGAAVKAESITKAPSLVISQLKITSSNGQMVVLYNATNSTIDMSKYQLQYFNSYDLAKATSSRLITLAGSLSPHSYYIVSDDTMPICYSATVSSMSLGFSSTSGYVGVLGLNQVYPGGLVSPSLEDYVGWSKTVAVGAQTLPVHTSASLLRQPFDLGNAPEIKVAGSGTWLQVRPGSFSSCGLVTNATTSRSIETGMNELLPSTEPPFTIIEDGADSAATETTAVSMSPNNIGLMKPKITELLPNPMGTGNDSSDEFIEIYNPNPKAFDLSGFSLKVGSSTVRSYTFPPGTLVPPMSFTAFFASTTKLSLSNTLSQASLLDPFGGIVSETEEYSSAKDGQAWILANNTWVWSITPTPNMSNILHAPPVKKPSKSSATKSSSKNSAKASSTKQGKSPKVLGANTKSSFFEAPQKTPIHAWTIALVGSLAILYAIYEYRFDIANKFHQLRKNYQARRRARQ